MPPGTGRFCPAKVLDFRLYEKKMEEALKPLIFTAAWRLPERARARAHMASYKLTGPLISSQPHHPYVHLASSQFRYLSIICRCLSGVHWNTRSRWERWERKQRPLDLRAIAADAISLSRFAAATDMHLSLLRTPLDLSYPPQRQKIADFGSHS